MRVKLTTAEITDPQRSLAVIVSVLCGLIISSGCRRDQDSADGQVIVFLIDDLDVSHQPQAVFEKISHGDAVNQILLQSGCRQEDVHGISVSGFGREVDYVAYLKALMEVDSYVSKHPNDKVVVNLSVGSRRPHPLEQSQIERLIANGVYVVAAAGNDGEEGVAFPAAYPGVIAVGALEKNGNVASYSNFGPEIDILADGTFKRFESRTIGNMQYSRTMVRGGTSFAAPRVAGTIARLLGYGAGNDVDVVKILKDTAIPLRDVETATKNSGAGRLYPHAALSVVEPLYWWKWFLVILACAIAVPATMSYRQPNGLIQRRHLRMGIGIFVAIAIVITLQQPLVRLYSIRTLMPLGLSGPMRFDALVLFAAVSSTLFPAAVPLIQARVRRWRFLHRVCQLAKEHALSQDFASLEKLLEAKDRGQRQAVISAVAKTGAVGIVVLVNYFAKTRIQLGAGEMRVLTGKTVRPVLESEILKSCQFVSEDLLVIAEHVETQYRPNVIAHVNPAKLREILVSIEINELTAILQRQEIGVIKKLVEHLPVEALRSGFLNVIHDEEVRMQARIGMDPRAQAYVAELEHIKSFVSTLVEENIVTLVQEQPRDTIIQCLKSMNGSEILSAVLNLSDFDVRGIVGMVNQASYGVAVRSLSESKVRQALARCKDLSDSGLKLPCVRRIINLYAIVRQLHWEQDETFSGMAASLTTAFPFLSLYLSTSRANYLSASRAMVERPTYESVNYRVVLAMAAIAAIFIVVSGWLWYIFQH